MFRSFLSAVGNWWADQRLGSLEEMARAAEQRAQKAVHEATEAERRARTELPLDRAERSQEALRASMAKVYDSSSYRMARSANQKYYAVMQALLFLLSWRAPIYTAPRAKVPLRRFVRAVERALVAREYSLKAQLRLLANYQAMVAKWSSLGQVVTIQSEPDLSKAQNYRGVVYYHETAVSAEMFENAVRADIQQGKIADLVKQILQAGESSGQPTGVRSCLVAVERELNSRSAYAAREVRYWFQSIYAIQIRFSDLESTAKILSYNATGVARARAMLAGASQSACLGLRQAYEHELASIEGMKQWLTSAAAAL
ncbi:MAG: hypothetical protein SFV17_10215 [Candidatus Obscuribacter sp.]|nr:hypothetical protein [Candidatus Obscuribacter sp.]